MVLPNDIDLLNPPPELEKRRHKFKRLVQSPNSFFMRLILSCSFYVRLRQIKGREVPGMLQHNDRLQPLADGGGVRRLPDHPLPADRRQSPTHRGLLL